jgi:hypothetical protein
MMLLILIFGASTVVMTFSFLSNSPFLYGVSSLLIALSSGALKLFIYEFITEIIFPVSPVFGLAILHSLSGLLSLVLTMFSDDLIRKTPNSKGFVYLIQLICLFMCLFCLFVFIRFPFKLNRSDYDQGRRDTMIPRAKPSAAGHSINQGGDEFNANSINSLLDAESNENSA